MPRPVVDGAGQGTRLLYQEEFEDHGQVLTWRGLKNTPAQSDRIFALSSGGRRQYFFLEIDEGTEAIVLVETVAASVTDRGFSPTRRVLFVLVN